MREYRDHYDRRSGDAPIVVREILQGEKGVQGEKGLQGEKWVQGPPGVPDPPGPAPNLDPVI